MSSLTTCPFINHNECNPIKQLTSLTKVNPSAESWLSPSSASLLLLLSSPASAGRGDGTGDSDLKAASPWGGCSPTDGGRTALSSEDEEESESSSESTTPSAATAADSGWERAAARISSSVEPATGGKKGFLVVEGYV